MLISDVSPSQLIYYHPERDLLPMVMANCNYSLEMGKGTSIAYDFDGLERQLEDNLIRGKPLLLLQVGLM